MAHKVLIVIGWSVIGLAAGSALGVAFWATYLTCVQGHTIADAVHGQVEDSLGLLQGLTVLGVLCGIGVGFCYGCCAVSVTGRMPSCE